MTTPRYRGIIPPLVTPLAGPDELHGEGFERLIDRAVAGGAAGIFVLGTSGEGPSLSHRLQRDTVAAACKYADGRVPVLVGVTDTSCEESVALAAHAADRGADAVVLAPPYYFPAGQTELERYVRRLCARAALPVILYNMPALTKVAFAPETLARLCDVDRIVGLKDSGGDLGYFREATALKARRPDWSVLIGPEALLPEALAAGGDGGVNGGANLFPKLFTRLFAALEAGDEGTAGPLAEQARRLGAIYTVGKYASRVVKALKSALSLEGVCPDRMAEPFNAFLPPERERVAAVLAGLDRGLCE